MNKPSTVWSSVGKKVLTGLTGVGLVLFIIVHLAGNLTLFAGSGAFNGYAHFLESVGHHAFLPIAEIGLALLFILHIVTGFTVHNDKWRARPVGYYKVADAKGKSRKTASSKSMIWTGIVLLLFLVCHLLQFRLHDAPMVGMPDGEETRNLYGLVRETFQSPAWVAIYVGVMLLLGVHVRHGFWSMLQSLGVTNKRTLPYMYWTGAVVGVVLAIGFIALPIYIYSTGSPQIGGLVP